MKCTTGILSVVLLAASGRVQGAPEAELPISARTADEVASDWSAVYYSHSSSSLPLLLGNDKGAASGGICAWALDLESSNATLPAVALQTPGRTKVLTTVYGVGYRDLVVTVADPDSIVRLFDASTLEVVDNSLKKVLGAWSALCSWRSPVSGEQYLYLFGKKQGIQFLLRAVDQGGFELVEIQSFETTVEASSCAVSPEQHLVFFSGDDDSTVYAFDATESTAAPEITILGEASDDITGIITYVGLETDYLLVAQTDIVEVYDISFNLLGTLTLSGDEDIEIQGLSIYQAALETYPAGILAYALESDAGEGFGASSLMTAFEALNLTLNTAYDPRVKPCKPASPITETCDKNGFDQEDGSCQCFAGFAGDTCASFTCREDCSGQGSCIGANTCVCNEGWGGLYCAFKIVTATEETDAFGGDGDDPAVWIHPTDKSQSKIITTIKSEEGAGLAVFHLNGTTAQTISAGEPDNVDVIYGFQAGNRTVDLAFAACRDDNTLWYEYLAIYHVRPMIKR
jgi:3-phytase